MPTQEKISIDLCICTFRRQHIVDTLRSVAQMTLKPNWDFRIIIADNDDTPSAQNRIEAVAKEESLIVTYIHAPARNISIARNACLDTATAPYIAFIDDDELVTPGWLAAMIDGLSKSGADVVMGPVQSIYGPTAPHWMKKGNFHSTLPVWVDNKITTGGGGNVLMHRTAPTIKGLRFRIDLGKSGGEDSAFFSSITQAGGRIAFAPEAIATEEVPPDRATLKWLIKRRFRCGQTYGTMFLETGKPGNTARFKTIFLACAKAGFCFCMALITMIRPQDCYFWALRGILHSGVICRLLGVHELEIYGSEAQT